MQAPARAKRGVRASTLALRAVPPPARDAREHSAPALRFSMDVSFLDSMEPEDRKVRSSLSFSRSEASLWFSEGESENDEPVDVAPATTPRRPTPARSRAATAIPLCS